MKGINYGRFISVYQSQDGDMYYNKIVDGMQAIQLIVLPVLFIMTITGNSIIVRTGIGILIL